MSTWISLSKFIIYIFIINDKIHNNINFYILFKIKFEINLKLIKKDCLYNKVIESRKE